MCVLVLQSMGHSPDDAALESALCVYTDARSAPAPQVVQNGNPALTYFRQQVLPHSLPFLAYPVTIFMFARNTYPHPPQLDGLNEFISANHLPKEMAARMRECASFTTFANAQQHLVHTPHSRYELCLMNTTTCGLRRSPPAEGCPVARARGEVAAAPLHRTSN